ncbi:GH3 family domain-containing protein [Candidatus Berkiella aquae]|uniref:GH3 auxin-responsive promoter n=1 Tax=Candidatus Berkiella aquae TaxID=295108 RepID=A0A0Q9YWU5_9GAMM|nr:GH3 auxin-responsive promoter family protein [Candidatus Berkiella aquae]MCS5710317.1 GH3 auxin-responsive promoter family protein [Candidatus Berkiella aquae]
MIPFQGQLAQTLFKTISANTYHHFIAALKTPAAVQTQLLNIMLAHLRETEYGQYLQLPKNANYDAYCRTVPIVNYEDLVNWIEKAKSSKCILTKENIDFFELTSGSTGAKKSIPYTQRLRKSFSSCFKIWGMDILQSGLSFNAMKIFMSISPHISHEANTIVLKEDSDYLTGLTKWLVKPFLVTQPNIHQLNEAEDFRFILALTLLAEENLEMISVWSPSYLHILLRIIEERFDEMCFYLGKSAFQYKNIDITLPAITQKRRLYLKTLNNHFQYQKLWPKLKLLSCWCAGSSQRSAELLAAQFPHVLVQGKGLLATEAPITIPLHQANGYVPMLQEVFFEFEDNQQNIFRIHELKENEQYEIIISQQSGLYRYRMGDSIRVTHFHQKTPCLEFIGRTKQTSDLVGEKLHEAFVTTIFNRAPFSQANYLLLVPAQLVSGQGQYYLLTDNPQLLKREALLDQMLCDAFHYKNARKMAQLCVPEIIYHADMMAIMNQAMEKRGIKMGDQKIVSLICCATMGEKLLQGVLQRKV